MSNNYPDILKKFFKNENNKEIKVLTKKKICYIIFSKLVIDNLMIIKFDMWALNFWHNVIIPPYKEQFSTVPLTKFIRVLK